MKSLVFHGPRDIRYESVADPILSNARSAIVKISKCGICGSDLHPYHVGSSSTGYCIGHEAVGEVVEVGVEVKKFKTGDRVIVAGSVSCGECEPCRNNLPMICRSYPTCRVFGQGMHGLGGGQAEAIEVPVADYNLHSTRGASDALGILLSDNLSTGWTCAKNAKVQPGSSVAVIGLGAVGLSGIVSAQALGADRVFAIDLLEDRLDAASALGAIPINATNALDEIRAATDGQGVDSILDAVGIAKTAELDALAVKRGGHVCIVGLPEAASVPFPLLTGIARNVTFTLTACSIQAALPELFDALESGKLKADAIERMVTHDIALSDGAAAYALFDARRDGVKKVLLTP
ncbi:alcohol dehydrogenase catalytic domain-containing protein [Sphingobium tyrosinilyticum]|uniref:Alcohol dehydrogenase catalytic domain-containing protein n=1 Tax=Sphingobium tyrosinilyticum TaxID=2715436 RepID=A0ABV9F6D0_9SPHN